MPKLSSRCETRYAAVRQWMLGRFNGTRSRHRLCPRTQLARLSQVVHLGHGAVTRTRLLNGRSVDHLECGVGDAACTALLSGIAGPAVGSFPLRAAQPAPVPRSEPCRQPASPRPASSWLRSPSHDRGERHLTGLAAGADAVGTHGQRRAWWGHRRDPAQRHRPPARGSPLGGSLTWAAFDATRISSTRPATLSRSRRSWLFPAMSSTCGQNAEVVAVLANWARIVAAIVH